MVAAFTTDIPALSQWGEPLLLGPGSIHVAHTPFEKIAKRELLAGGGPVLRSGAAARAFADRPVTMTFAWRTRLKYGLLAALAGWLAGWLVSYPLCAFARLALCRCDTPASCPTPWPKGWWCGAASACSWRWQDSCPWCCRCCYAFLRAGSCAGAAFCIPGVTLAAILAIYHRMGLLNDYYFRHPEDSVAFFFTAPNLFRRYLRPGDDVGVYRCWRKTTADSRSDLNWRNSQLTMDSDL